MPVPPERSVRVPPSRDTRVPPSRGARVPPPRGTRVPIGDLIDLSRVGPRGRPPTLREIRDALPRGWVLDDDGETARRDTRLWFKEGWVLMLGLVCFGAAAIGFFVWSTPRNGSVVLRIAAIVAIVLVAGGLVAPIVTRALTSKRREP